jgi:hypothetical protein
LGQFSLPVAPANWYSCLGVATDRSGNIYASQYYVGGVSKFAPDGSLLWYAPPQVESGDTHATLVDSDENVWLVHLDISKLSKFRGTDGSPLGVFDSGYHPYTYSDATGMSLRTAASRRGSWTIIYDAGTPYVGWGTISWHSDEPQGTSITVTARSSNDQATWSAWETATNGVLLTATPEGQYLQIQASFQRVSEDVTPILYDLTATGTVLYPKK